MPALGTKINKLDFAATSAKRSNRLEANPEGFPFVHKDFRLVMVQRFPYILIYRIRDRRIEVHAVFHTHRDIDTWKSKH